MKFELKKYSCAVSWKAIFSLVKDFFNWIEGLRRTVITLVGSETEIIFHLGGLRKKGLSRQILSSKLKIHLGSFMKSDVQSSEGFFRMKWGPTKECDNPSRLWNRANFPSKRSTKKVHNTLSKFELKKYSWAVYWKAIFSLVKGFFNWNERLRSSVTFLVGSGTEIIFHLGGLWKKYLTRCQISSSKNTLVLFLEKRFSA